MSPLHFFPRRDHIVVNNWFARPPMMWDPLRYDMMMFNCMKPVLISNMISNIGNTIANLISGGKNINNSCNCNHSMLYSNNMLSNTMMYPYVNLNNTRQKSTEIEGKGSTSDDNSSATIAKMENAYKEYGVSAIYQLDDGRYCAVTENGNITGLTLSDLADEISDYYTKKKSNSSEEVGDEVLQEQTVQEVTPEEVQKVTQQKKGQIDNRQEVNKYGSFSKHFKRNEWHRYLANKNARAEEYKNVSLELGKTINEPHRNNPAEYALNSLIAQLGLTGADYNSDLYKDLLKDFKLMNPSLFNPDGSMKNGYENHIDKLDLPSKEALIKVYGLKAKENQDPQKTAQTGGKYKEKLPNGKYGYQYANGNMMYSSRSFDNLDTDAIFKISGQIYTIGGGIDYWDILGQRTSYQNDENNIIDPKTGKFRTDKDYPKGKFKFFHEGNGPLKGAYLIKENNKVYVLLKNGQKYLADEVMAGKYNNILK